MCDRKPDVLWSRHKRNGRRLDQNITTHYKQYWCKKKSVFSFTNWVVLRFGTFYSDYMNFYGFYLQLLTWVALHYLAVCIISRHGMSICEATLSDNINCSFKIARCWTGAASGSRTITNWSLLWVLAEGSALGCATFYTTNAQYIKGRLNHATVCLYSSQWSIGAIILFKYSWDYTSLLFNLYSPWRLTHTDGNACGIVNLLM